eukprot:6199335-Pleurochrysis_carterae.AAC.1
MQAKCAARQSETHGTMRLQIQLAPTSRRVLAFVPATPPRQRRRQSAQTRKRRVIVTGCWQPLMRNQRLPPAPVSAPVEGKRGPTRTELQIDHGDALK